jgi:predicted ABC-class ATPase
LHRTRSQKRVSEKIRPKRKRNIGTKSSLALPKNGNEIANHSNVEAILSRPAVVLTVSELRQLSSQAAAHCINQASADSSKAPSSKAKTAKITTWTGYMGSDASAMQACTPAATRR